MDAVEGVLDIGDAVPPFTLDSQVGEVDFEDIVDGKWCLLITVGAAFDPVATTDVGMLSRFEMEFESRNINVLVVGNDSVPNYRKWVRDIEELQAVKVNVPLMSDKECNILKKFGCARYMAKEGKSAVCCFGCFLIDLDRRIRFTTKSGTTNGRNFYEVLRMFDALQLSIHNKILTPCNWGQGQDILLSGDITKDEATMFRFTEVKPWFRLAPIPDDL
jgi:alkyl hydroperoxide reductase subunit AhpC